MLKLVGEASSVLLYTKRKKVKNTRRMVRNSRDMDPNMILLNFSPARSCAGPPTRGDRWRISINFHVLPNGKLVFTTPWHGDLAATQGLRQTVCLKKVRQP
jgi:hypothetical protein